MSRMDPAYRVAYKKTASWLFKSVQETVIQSRLTRWRDMFLVNRIVEDECKRYWEYAPAPFSLATLEPAIPRNEIVMLVEQCLHRIGDERALPVEEIEAGIERAKLSIG